MCLCVSLCVCCLFVSSCVCQEAKQSFFSKQSTNTLSLCSPPSITSLAFLSFFTYSQMSQRCLLHIHLKCIPCVSVTVTFPTKKRNLFMEKAHLVLHSCNLQAEVTDYILQSCTLLSGFSLKS